jgi:hypothetical protein
MLKILVVLAALGGLGYGGAWGYGWMQLASAENAFGRRLVEAGKPTLTEPVINLEVVRRRLIAIGREEGLDVAPDDVQVTIEPLDPSNIERLASFERSALGIAAKLPNHDLGAMFLGMRVTVRQAWGPVKREAQLERNTYVVKSAVQ